jgi:hypothetical protein
MRCGTVRAFISPFTLAFSAPSIRQRQASRPPLLKRQELLVSGQKKGASRLPLPYLLNRIHLDASRLQPLAARYLAATFTPRLLAIQRAFALCICRSETIFRAGLISLPSPGACRADRPVPTSGRPRQLPSPSRPDLPQPQPQPISQLQPHCTPERSSPSAPQSYLRP